MEFYRQVLNAKKENKLYAVATVVQTEGNTPRKPGAKMLVFSDGSIFGSVGGNGAGQMCGHTGSGDEAAEAVFTGVQRKIPGLLGSAVGRVDMNFVGNFQRRQGVHGLAQDRQIAVAAHDDTNFFHGLPPK